MVEPARIGQETVEVLVPMDRSAAEKLDVRIRRMAETAGHQIGLVRSLLEEARSGGVHDVLGFASWPAYVADACEPLGRELTAEARRPVVSLMFDAGMSERAIARAVGASKSTIHRDIEEVVHHGPPDDRPPEVAPEPVAEPAAVAGLDGKTYSRRERATKSKPTTAKPPSLPEAFRDAVLELEKASNRVATLAADDRLPQDREQLRPLRWDLVRVNMALTNVVFALDGNTTPGN